MSISEFLGMINNTSDVLFEAALSLQDRITVDGSERVLSEDIGSCG